MTHLKVGRQVVFECILLISQICADLFCVHPRNLREILI